MRKINRYILLRLAGIDEHEAMTYVNNEACCRTRSFRTLLAMGAIKRRAMYRQLERDAMMRFSYPHVDWRDGATFPVEIRARFLEPAFN